MDAFGARVECVRLFWGKGKTMAVGHLNVASLSKVIIFFFFGTIWASFAFYLRIRRKKNTVFLVLFTLFYFYLYEVFDYTLFQFQSLLILKYFVPNLILNGQPAGNSINLVPLITLTVGDLKTSLLNILLMIPFGLGLPFLSRLQLGRVVILGGLLSLLIEFLQFTSGLLAKTTFRIADINDLIFNTLGVAIGYVLFLLFMRLLRHIIKEEKFKENPFLYYIVDLRKDVELRTATTDY